MWEKMMITMQYYVHHITERGYQLFNPDDWDCQQRVKRIHGEDFCITNNHLHFHLNLPMNEHQLD